MTEVTCNYEVTCDFCGRDFPVADVETNDQGQAVCKTCLEDGTAKICAECGSFQYSENMHFVIGLHVEVCDECWYGPYGRPENEKEDSSPLLLQETPAKAAPVKKAAAWSTRLNAGGTTPKPARRYGKRLFRRCILL